MAVDAPRPGLKPGKYHSTIVIAEIWLLQKKNVKGALIVHILLTKQNLINFFPTLIFL